LMGLIMPTVALAIGAAWITESLESVLTLELSSLSVFPMASIYFALLIPAFLITLLTVFRRFDEGAFILKMMKTVAGAARDRLPFTK